MRILLIDNDESLVESLKQNLSRQNYVVDAVTTGEAGWQYGSTYPYDLIILDWVLPGIDGITLCQKFRVNGYHFPILILTTRNSSQDKARGLDAGADDYLGKPFDLEELGARIRALLRRDNTEPLPIIVWENIQLDPCSCEVAYDGHLLSLTAKEYGLLELLLRHHHYVLQTEEIIDNLWSSEEYPAEATVRSHLRSLRQKLKQAGAPGDLIETVRGVGYRLKTLTNPGHVLTSAAPPEPPNPPMTGLTAIWGKYQKQQQIQLAILDQTLDQTLAQMVAAIQSGLNFSPNPSHWEQAKLSACKLSESLELFGFDQGSRLAHTLEHLLQQFPQPDLQTSEFTDFVKQFQVTLRALHQELAVAPEMLTPKKQFADFNPVALLVSEENSFAQSLVKAAQSTGIRTFLAPTLAAAKNLLYPETSPSWQMPLRPDIVVVKLTFQAIAHPMNHSLSNAMPQTRTEVDARLDLSERLALISELKLRSPTCPVLVIADQDQFAERLEIARRGGWLFLREPVTPGEVVAQMINLFQSTQGDERIMIVDDNREWLGRLPSSLQPWGFKLTTLGDTRQFWHVLCAVDPHLLVLQVEMPHVSGIELCQVVRSHPRWHHLPIIFLSDQPDLSIQRQAFSVGGDDFLTKPLISQDLANRIRNRLGRVRTLQDQTE